MQAGVVCIGSKEVQEVCQEVVCVGESRKWKRL